MFQPTKFTLKHQFNLVALLALPVLLSIGQQQAFAQDFQRNLSGLKGHVVAINAGDKDAGEQANKTFAALSDGGLDNGVGLPTADTSDAIAPEAAKQNNQPKKLELKAEEPRQTASLDLPTVDKVPVQKGKAESDGTVSHGESGVDWSKWVSALADRWFSNLKNLEFRSNKAYRTVRPALIRFTCYRSGYVGNITVRQSCGVPAYDLMQIEALKRCMPLPPFPEGSIRMSYTLLQGWECRPHEEGDQDFKPGSFGKNFPTEHVPIKGKSAAHGKTPIKAKAKTKAKA